MLVQVIIPISTIESFRLSSSKVHSAYLNISDTYPSLANVFCRLHADMKESMVSCRSTFSELHYRV